MKILHTSDWHLGKYLDQYSRIQEQILFIDELEQISNDNFIDLIIISGDIYDTINPPVNAEKLFFNAIKRLSLNGQRPIVIISGNHDSSSKLFSPTPLTNEFGIFIQTSLLDTENIVPTGNYKNFKIINSGTGFFEIEINTERAVILTIPYITEKSLNKVIFNSLEEDLQQKEFSLKVKEILDSLSQNFREDTINIAIMHLFAKNSIESDSERKIQSIGGTYAIDTSVFPKNAQYIALGHLHRFQEVKNNNCMAYYSGSPIRYSKSEAGYDKAVIVLDIHPNIRPELKKVVLQDYKPMHILNCTGYEDALEKVSLIKEKSCYIFIEIKTKVPISMEQIRELKEYIEGKGIEDKGIEDKDIKDKGIEDKDIDIEDIDIEDKDKDKDKDKDIDIEDKDIKDKDIKDKDIKYTRDIVSLVIKADLESQMFQSINNICDINNINEEISILEEFKKFYLDKKDIPVSDEVLDEFLHILQELEAQEHE